MFCQYAFLSTATRVIKSSDRISSRHYRYNDPPPVSLSAIPVSPVIVTVFVSLRLIQASHFRQIPRCHNSTSPCSFCNYGGHTTPDIQAPRPAMIKPPIEMAKGLIVAFKFRKKKIQATGGTKRQPKNHQRLRL